MDRICITLHRISLLLIPAAIPLFGLASTASAQVDLMTVEVIDVMGRARNYNWMVRVHADSIHEGRVTFVHPNAARVGRSLVPFDRVTRVERSGQADVSSRTGGLAIGAGVGLGLGALLAAFAAGMGGSANLVIIPLIGMFAVLGGLIGSGGDPPDREWTTVWQK